MRSSHSIPTHKGTEKKRNGKKKEKKKAITSNQSQYLFQMITWAGHS